MRISLTLILFLIPAILYGTVHPNFEEAQTKLDKDIASAMKEFQHLQNNISVERTKLSKSLLNLEEELKSIRMELHDLDKAQTMKNTPFENLKRSIKNDELMLQQIQDQALNFRSAMELNMLAIEAAQFSKSVSDLTIKLNSLDQKEWSQSLNLLYQSSLTILKRKSRIYQTAGDAILENGQETSGQFMIVGPLSYFKNESMKSGIVISKDGINMHLFEKLSAQQKKEIINLFNGERASVPFDTSGGKALQINLHKKDLLETLKSGGLVIIPIALIGMASLILILLKFLSLRHLTDNYDQHVSSLFIKEPEETLIALESKSEEIFSSIAKEGLTHHKESQEVIEECMFDKLLFHMPKLEQHLSTLAVFAAIAPLLGLLGTVTGMIQTFHLVTVYGSGDAKLLSGGISEALITTACGLFVAIPVMFFHALLNRKVKKIIDGLQRAIFAIVHQIKLRKT